jgi:repeat motif protein bdrA4
MKNELNVKIMGDRNDTENPMVKLTFEELDEAEIVLTDSKIDDIKDIFNKLFDYIMANKDLVELKLEDDQNDLYHEVAADIIQQLNSEISQSSGNFKRLWQLDDEINTEDNEVDE